MRAVNTGKKSGECFTLGKDEISRFQKKNLVAEKRNIGSTICNTINLEVDSN